MYEKEYDYSDGNEAEEKHDHLCAMRDIDQGIPPSCGEEEEGEE